MVDSHENGQAREYSDQVNPADVAPMDRPIGRAAERDITQPRRIWRGPSFVSSVHRIDLPFLGLTEPARVGEDRLFFTHGVTILDQGGGQTIAVKNAAILCAFCGHPCAAPRNVGRRALGSRASFRKNADAFFRNEAPSRRTTGL